MIVESCSIYVIGKGFVDISMVGPGDIVYTISSDLKVEETVVSSSSSEFVTQSLNFVDSGQHKIEATNETMYFYTSERHGTGYFSFDMIPKITPDKDYIATKYLPVLSWPNLAGYRNNSDLELEYCARMLAAGREAFDLNSFLSISRKCTGEDAFIFVDMIEFWHSRHPGLGWFDKVQVKSRAHVVYDDLTMYEVMRLACMAGYTSSFQKYEHDRVVNISYESTPIPGSRPKSEKYKKSYYIGNVYSINAKNRPILGTYKNKCYYLPCSTK